MSLQFFQHPLLSNISIVIHPPNMSKSGSKNQMSVWLQIYWQSVKRCQIRRCVVQIYWWSVSPPPDTRYILILRFSRKCIFVPDLHEWSDLFKGRICNWRWCRKSLLLHFYIFSVQSHIFPIWTHLHLLALKFDLNFYSPTQIFSIRPHKYFLFTIQIFSAVQSNICFDP